MNQELKQKAYQVLIDKIEVGAFEEYLYKQVEESTMLKSGFSKQTEGNLLNQVSSKYTLKVLERFEF